MKQRSPVFVLVFTAVFALGIAFVPGVAWGGVTYHLDGASVPFGGRALDGASVPFGCHAQEPRADIVHPASLDPGGGTSSPGDGGGGDDGGGDSGGSDPGGDTGGDTGGGGGGGSGGSGGGGGDSGPSPAELEMQARTEEVLSALEEDAAVLSALDEAASSYLRESATAAAFLSDIHGTYNESGYRRQYLTDQYELAVAAQTDRTIQARHDARGTHEKLRSEAVGDTVRLSDGAYVSLIPMPVIRHHGLTLDIAPRYDSARTSRNIFGTGWFSLLDSRVFQGATAPPQTEALIAESVGGRNALAAELQGIWAEVFAAGSNADTRQTIRMVLEESALEAIEIAAQLRDLVEELEEDILRFQLSGVNTTALTAARDLADAMALEAEDSGSAWQETGHVLLQWEQSNTALDSFSREIDRIEGEVEEALLEQTVVLQRNAGATLSGQYPFLGESGDGTAIVIAPNGSPVLFLRNESDDSYRAQTGDQGRLYDLGLNRGWRWELPDGTSRVYGPAGFLSTLTDRNGNSLIFDRESSGGTTVLTIGDDLNRELVRIVPGNEEVLVRYRDGSVFTFRIEENRLHRVETPRGSMDYSYSGSHIVSMISGTGAETIIFWETVAGVQRVRSVTDPEGGTEEFFYPGPEQRVYRDADGVETSYTVRHGLTLVEHHPEGFTVHYVYDDAGNLLNRFDSSGYRQEWIRDHRGMPAGEDDSAGFWSRTERDGFGLPLSHRTDRGTVYTIQRDSQGNATEVFETGRDAYSVAYRENGLPRRITYAGGARFLLEHDEAGRIIRLERNDGQEREFRYDLAGRLVEERLNGETVATAEFDDAGRLVAGTEGDDSRAYRYDEAGNRYREYRRGHHYRTGEFDRRGLPTRWVYYDGTFETFSYTPAGRLLTHRNRRGAVFRYTYDQAGRIAAVSEESTGYVTRWERDSFGRIISRREPNGTKRSIAWSPRGEIERVVDPTVSVLRRTVEPGGTITTVLEYAEDYHLERRRRFDTQGRLQREEREDGTIRTIEFTPELRIERFDGASVRRDVLDQFGRTIREEYPDGTATILKWDHFDHIVEVRDRAAGIHLFRWDPTGRLVRYTDPVGRVTRWTFTENGSRRVDPDGTIVERSRDLDNRPLQLDGTVIQYTGVNQATLTHESGLVETVMQDVLGRVREHTMSSPYMHSRTIRRDYPRPGTVHVQTGVFETREERHSDGTHTITLPGGTLWFLEMDFFGYPRSVRSPAGRTTSFSWSPEGVPRSFRPPAPGASTTRFQYDSLHRMIEKSAGAEILAVIHDDTDRTSTFTADGEVFQIGTDPLGRVVRETHRDKGGVTIDRRYRYDAAGRRVETRDALTGDAIHTVYGDEDGTVTLSTGAFRLLLRTRDGKLAGGEVSVGGEMIPIRIEHHTDRSTMEIGKRVILTHRRESGRNRGDESLVMAFRTGAGREQVLDALSYTRDRHGRLVGEATLEGRITTWSYDELSRLKETITGPCDPQPGSPVAHIDSNVERTLLEVLHRAAPALRFVTGTTLGFTTVRPRDRDGRISSSDQGWDSRGRVREMVGPVRSHPLELRYDPIFGRIRSVHCPETGEDLVIYQDQQGAPAGVRVGPADEVYNSLEQTLRLRGQTITVRRWRRDTDAPARTPTGRYLPRDAANAVAGSGTALEIRINGRPFVVVDDRRLFVYFSDVRGTTRGVAVVHHGERSVAYHAYRDRTRSADLPGAGITEETVPRSPAVPIRRTYAGLDRYTEDPIFFSRNRVYLPGAGLFTTPDPLLDGLDPYLYADGDPVNHVDLEGLYIAQVSTTYFQQDPRYGYLSLGLTGQYSIRDYGCVLVSASRIVNTVVGHEEATPGTINTLFTRAGVYDDQGLLSTTTIAQGIEELTGHAARVTSFSPEEVHIDTIARYLQEDPDQERHVTARITVPYVNAQGEIGSYQHTLNVIGFTETSDPLFADSSNRNRLTLSEGERVDRYDVYTTSACPQFR